MMHIVGGVWLVGMKWMEDRIRKTKGIEKGR